MSKYIAESFYTCLFKITHNLQELTNEALQEIDSRKDGKVEVLDVKFNKKMENKSFSIFFIIDCSYFARLPVFKGIFKFI